VAGGGPASGADPPALPARPAPGAPLPVGVLASGEGTNLQALLDTVHGREARIVGVVSDRPAARALRRARAAGVDHAAFPLGDHADRETRDAAMADWLAHRGARLVVLAGYMALLTPAFLARFPAAVLNVHPSLLPAFPGLRAIERAVAAGERVFGVTVHLVDAGVDTGPIVLQRSTEPSDPTDPAAVHRALQPLEHALLPEAVRRFARGGKRPGAA